MKINSVELENLPKKQLRELYFKAFCGEIDDKELERIKGALAEIVPLCYFESSTFIDLIETLDSFSDKALKDIEKGTFTYFFRRGKKDLVELSSDFASCVGLLNAIYGDYKGIKNMNDYLEISSDVSELSDYVNIDIKNLIKLLYGMNLDLAQLIFSTKYLEAKKINEQLNNMDFYTKISYEEIKSKIIASYMMSIDEYKDNYQIVGNVLEKMLEDLTEKGIQRLHIDMTNTATDRLIAKEILDNYVNCINDDSSFTINSR